jgi:hypothetical protein
MCLVDENDKVQGKKKGRRWNEEQIFYVYMYLVCLYAVRDNLTEASDRSSFYTLFPRGERRARGGDGQLQMVEIEGRCGEVLLTVVHVMLFSADTSRLPEIDPHLLVNRCLHARRLLRLAHLENQSSFGKINTAVWHTTLCFIHMPMPRSEKTVTTKCQACARTRYRSVFLHPLPRKAP